MAESKPKLKPNPNTNPPADIAAAAPLAALLLGLLFVWTVSVFALRNIEMAEAWPRQVYPLLLWLAGVYGWVRWQKTPQPARWLGLLPLGLREIGLAVAAFAIVLGWNLIRVMLDHAPGGILAQLPPEIYLWIAAGVFMNELLFRGLVQTRLAELFGPAIAIPAAAVATVVFRIPSYFTSDVPIPFDPMALVNVFLIAILAGALRHFGRSLWPAVAVHWANSFGSLL